MAMAEKYFIKTFGCQQNVADSERLERFYESRGLVRAALMEEADVLILNTCVIRDRAEEKVYGMVKSVRTRLEKSAPRIVVTGCLIGAAARIPGGKMMKRLTTRLPDVEFLPIDEVGFEYAPKRPDRTRWPSSDTALGRRTPDRRASPRRSAATRDRCCRSGRTVLVLRHGRRQSDASPCGPPQ